MSDAKSHHDLGVEESELRYWLANEDWYISQYARQWLLRTPPQEAADVLARIAEDAQAEPRSFFSVAATVIATSGFATSTGIAGEGPDARRAGTRAALMLANLQDARCLPPLVRVFHTGGFLQSKYREMIEAALLRFLTEAEGRADVLPFVSDIRSLAEGIWGRENERHDLSPAFKNLLIVALRWLQAANGEADRALLTAIATRAVADKQTNRQEAKQIAAGLLSS